MNLITSPDWMINCLPLTGLGDKIVFNYQLNSNKIYFFITSDIFKLKRLKIILLVMNDL